MPEPTTDTQRQIMLLAIQNILSAREWDSDTCDEIATVMIVNGYPIADIDNNMDIPGRTSQSTPTLQ